LFGHIVSARDSRLEAGLRTFLDDPLFAPARALPTLASRLEQIMTDGHLGQGADFLHVLDALGIAAYEPERLAQLHIPTLVVLGELDTLQFHASARELGKCLNEVSSTIVRCPRLLRISFDDPRTSMRDAKQRLCCVMAGWNEPTLVDWIPLPARNGSHFGEHVGSRDKLELKDLAVEADAS
jgi:hypothetical protein